MYLSPIASPILPADHLLSSKQLFLPSVLHFFHEIGIVSKTKTQTLRVWVMKKAALRR